MTDPLSNIPTREILWNVSSISNVIIMYSLFAASLLIAALGAWRHVELWQSGQEAKENTGRPTQRWLDFFRYALFQRKVAQKKTAGLAHTLVYSGFLALLFATTMVFIDHDLGIRIYQGDFYLGVTLVADVFGAALIVGCLLFAHRRYIQQAELLHSRPTDAFFLIFLVLLSVQGFILEGLRIFVTHDEWAIYSPVGLLFSKFFWPLTPSAAEHFHFAMWWFHTITVFIFLALLPYSKLWHVIASSANLYFKDSGRARGELPSPGDIEEIIENEEEVTIGRGTIKDYSWKQLLDLDACTSCGRCQEVCPAYLSGKPLSPKWLILDSRNHAFALQQKDALAQETSFLPAWARKLDAWLNKHLFFPSLGLSLAEGNYIDDGQFRAPNEQVQRSAQKIGVDPDDIISGTVLDENVFWSCTTCGACVEACPVGIHHVEHIIDNRRHMVLMEGRVPSEAQATLRALENRGNPFGPPEERTSWLGDLEVHELQEGDSTDYLYWVGCVSSYDPRKQKIAQSLVKIMQAAGLSFGILGSREKCSGDPARRLGEENLFQALAKANIETLESVSFKTIIASCPHCFNTLQHEYAPFRDPKSSPWNVMHHSTLIAKLLGENVITLRKNKEAFTFHDPCYLGRNNGVYDAPRRALQQTTTAPIEEMEMSREKGLCCGAGGGHFWMDLKIGERVNVLRTDQAAATKAKHVATGCPFCMQMMEDGVKLTDREEQLDVRDIAEVVAEQLVLP